MIEIKKHLEHAVSAGASDILVISGMPISYKLGAELVAPKTSR
jgi:Tfp pilus assembly ATPase PilU